MAIGIAGAMRMPWRTRSNLDPHRLSEASVALEVVAVFTVTGGMFGLRQQQSVAVMRTRLRVVLEQRQPELLVVRIVADLDSGGRERLDQRRSIVSGGEVGRGERDGLVGLEREQRRFQLGEELSRRPPRGAGRRRERAPSVRRPRLFGVSRWCSAACWMKEAATKRSLSRCGC